MAKYIALVGFAGVEISAYQGQEIELPDNDTTEELVSIGYLKPLDDDTTDDTTDESKPLEDEQSKSARGKKK